MDVAPLSGRYINQIDLGPGSGRYRLAGTYIDLCHQDGSWRPRSGDPQTFGWLEACLLISVTWPTRRRLIDALLAHDAAGPAPRVTVRAAAGPRLRRVSPGLHQTADGRFSAQRAQSLNRWHITDTTRPGVTIICATLAGCQDSVSRAAVEYPAGDTVKV